MARRYWLMKVEPEVYSIDDLARDGTTFWEGVRNYQARNSLRDDFQVGDGVLYYHSNAEPAGVAGVAEVSRAGYPDHTAQDPASPYHDPKATPDNPIWFMVDIRFVRKFPRVLTLDELRTAKGLQDMLVLRKGQRLSVMPVTAGEFKIVEKLGGKA